MTEPHRRTNLSPEQYLAALGDEGSQLPEAEPPKRRRRIRVKGIFLGILIAIIILLVATGIYGYRSLASISKNPLSLTPLVTDGHGRTNVLVLGIGDPGHSGQDLSDTNLVLSFDRSTKQVAEISVPRDTRVDIPGYGYNKINTANALGGSDLARKVVSQTLGIPIDYVVTTDFTGLSDMVDAVGGIDVDVQDELKDTEYPCADNQYLACGIDIKPGMQHMNGAVALEYVRCRKGTCGNDFGRAARQQEVINLIRQKATKPSFYLNPIKFRAFATAVRTNLTTDLSALNMAQLALSWQQQKGQPIQLVLSTDPDSYLTGAYGSSDLVPRDGTFAAIQAKFRTIFEQ